MTKGAENLITPVYVKKKKKVLGMNRNFDANSFRLNTAVRKIVPVVRM